MENQQRWSREITYLNRISLAVLLRTDQIGILVKAGRREEGNNNDPRKRMC